ncbi:Gluconokinase [Streptomyces sp. enrichment culture]
MSTAGGGRVVVVMGVAGTGKTTVGRLLAKALGLPFAEGDDHHPPANVAKMTAGIPLDDDDRRPWLDAVAARLGGRPPGTGAVVSCSALRRAYRDRLRAAVPEAVFVHLAGDRRLIEGRIAARTGHFMPPALLDSQFAVLEPLGPDEPGAVVDVSGTPEETAAGALAALAAVWTDRPRSS